MLEGDGVGGDVLLHAVLAGLVKVTITITITIGYLVRVTLGLVQTGAFPSCDGRSWSVSLTSRPGRKKLRVGIT